MVDEERVPEELARPLHVAWHEILPLIDAIEQRLTAIEDHLGISGEIGGVGGVGGVGAEEAERHLGNGG